jgi:hypothetical protein
VASVRLRLPGPISFRQDIHFLGFHVLRLKIALATYYTHEYAQLAEATNRTKHVYCDRHGYTFRYQQSDAGFTAETTPWDRLSHLQQVMGEGFDVVMLIDADAFIANPTIKVEDRFLSDMQLLLTADINGINNGIFIIRNSQIMREYLHAVLNHGRMMYQTHPCREQESMWRMASSPPYAQHVTWAEPQNYLMSYMNEFYGRSGWRGSYQPGDWAIHLPAIDTNTRIRIVQEYGAK